MAAIDPTTTKYLIRARIEAEGVVEKPDVVGAVFGQTEGLLGDELDLRDLQKSGRIGRIEVDVQSKKGKTEGTVLVPSSLDQVETSILAASLETIDRIGPCKARIEVEKIEDVRVTKRTKIVERAKSLLSSVMEESKVTGLGLTDEVRQSIQVSEITSFGPERLPAGPNVSDSDAIIIVEGRSDVLNLLKCGIKNVIAVEGTSISKSIVDLSKEKVVTLFLDGDRGGDLILKEFLQVAEVDFIARAPRGKEVEELTQKQIMKALRSKVPAEQYVEMFNLEAPLLKHREGEGREGPRFEKALEAERPTASVEAEPFEHPAHVERQERMGPQDRPERGRPERFDRGDRRDRRFDRREERREERREDRREERREPREPREETPPHRTLSPELERYKDMLRTLTGTSKAQIIDPEGNVALELPVRDLVETLKREPRQVKAVVFDGIITQRILDLASDMNMAAVIGTKMGNIVKQPTSVEVLTRNDLGV
jgi:DNA primase